MKSIFKQRKLKLERRNSPINCWNVL